MDKTRMTFEWGRWLGLAKMVWGVAREKGVDITWFRRTYPWLVRERLEVEIRGKREAFDSFWDAVFAGMNAT
jgi:hypothetical protein